MAGGSGGVETYGNAYVLQMRRAGVGGGDWRFFRLTGFCAARRGAPDCTLSDPIDPDAAFADAVRFSAIGHHAARLVQISIAATTRPARGRVRA